MAKILFCHTTGHESSSCYIIHYVVYYTLHYTLHYSTLFGTPRLFKKKKISASQTLTILPSTKVPNSAISKRFTECDLKFMTNSIKEPAQSQQNYFKKIHLYVTQDLCQMAL